jgi:hypothetical protein
MNDPAAALKTQLARQVAHWNIAAASLQNLDDLAAPSAWDGLERYMGLSLRQHLGDVVGRLNHQAGLLRAALDAAYSPAELGAVQRQLLAFRRVYLRAETTLYFFGDAIRTRTNPTVAGLLRACDSLAHRSMTQMLDQLGRPSPVVLTYLDKGLGASILKAGLRLWDGGRENPAAAIKIVRHNLYHPTALIHETGHQVAHIVGWTEELAAVLGSDLQGTSNGVVDLWASWASEIAADAFAFAHTGYASVAALHDVVAGEEPAVLRHIPGDPHPIGYVRVLLGVEMCRQCYGAGPWDDLALAWTRHYPLERATPHTQGILRASLPLLPEIAALVLRKPLGAFGGRPLCALIDPSRVSPEALAGLERRLGAALFTSMHWIWTEALRLLALTGLRAATQPEWALDVLKLQEGWMLRLGGAVRAA